jgi:hypothetical protein
MKLAMAVLSVSLLGTGAFAGAPAAAATPGVQPSPPAPSASAAPGSRAMAAVAPPDVSPVKVAIGGLLDRDPRIAYRVYVRGHDQQIWSRNLTSAGVPATGWASLPGVVGTGPDVASNGARTQALLAAGSVRRTLLVRQLTTTGVRAWTDLGGTLTSAPSVTYSFDSTSTAVVVRGADGGAWLRLRRAGVWQPWRAVGGTFTSAVDVAVGGGVAGLLVSGRGTDGRIWNRYLDQAGAPERPWFNTGVPSASANTAYNALPEPHYHFVGPDGGLTISVLGDAPLRHYGGVLTSPPDGPSMGFSPPVLHVARGADNGLWLFDFVTWRGLGGIVT